VSLAPWRFSNEILAERLDRLTQYDKSHPLNHTEWGKAYYIK